MGVQDKQPVIVAVPIRCGGEGCTPGYWKQKQHYGSWVGYTRKQTFESVFSVDYFLADGKTQKTLLQALKSGGGGDRALGRHAVATLLNASSSVNYAYNKTYIIEKVQEVWGEAGNRADKNVVKNLLAEQNEMGCPLGRAE